MSTDKIQTALYAKADAELLADVSKATQLSLRVMSDTVVKLPVYGNSAGRVKKQDGTFLASDQYAAMGLSGAVLHASLSEVLKALRSALFDALQIKYREKAVTDFMTKVDQLSNDVAELQDRLSNN
jgi:hypothetical protein